jgi:hypothetical protein
METSASFEACYAPLLYPTDHLPRPAISLVQQARYRALGPPAGGNVFATVWDYPIRGLNKNHSHDLKNIFKGAAIRAAAVRRAFPGLPRCPSCEGAAATEGDERRPMMEAQRAK